MKSAAYEPGPVEALTVVLDPNAAEDPELFPLTAFEVNQVAMGGTECGVGARRGLQACWVHSRVFRC